MKDILKPKELAKLLNVNVTTLQRWDREKTLVAYRNPKNRRYYTMEQYYEFIGDKKDKTTNNTYLYARVSSSNQKDDLENQVQFLKQYALSKGYKIEDTLTDVGSGLNYKRFNFNKLIDLCVDRKVKTIIITHKDRFVRFGFDFLKDFLKRNYDVDIIPIDNSEKSKDEELVEDLISIIHVFSCRVYGLRKYKKMIKDDINKGDI